MILAQDFEDFVSLLNDHSVRYMVVGGYALAFHGKPRHTGDLDIWIGISEQNAEKMLHVVTDFGLGSLGFTLDDFLKEGYITQIGYPPLRIDILNSIDGVEFDEAYKNKQEIDLDGLTVVYIGLNDFIQNKTASGRARDLSDIKELKAGSKADKAYSVMEIRKTHQQAYLPWTKEDDNKLELLFSEGKKVKELVQVFGRNKGAINSRIKKLQLKEKYNK